MSPWKAIETAPKDGTMVRLLVDYSGEQGDNPLEDKEQASTIGFNSFEDTGDDVWQFAGWSWHQDCFCQGHGRPIGWLPLVDPSVYDEKAGMCADGEQMTAAENVLAYLAVSVCGAIDDEPISPIKAQRIIEANAQELREILAKIVVSAKLLQANAMGCASEHHGHDFSEFGMPGWLADCQADISAAEAAIRAFVPHNLGEGVNG